MKTLVAACLLAAATLAAAQEARGPEPLLDKAGAYVGAFKLRFAGVVAEERYTQVFNSPQGDSPFNQPLQRDGTGGSFAGAKPGVTVTRSLVSDYLLVQTPAGDGWIPFRDVFEVDGKPVRDRDDRLTKLFVNPSGDAFAQAESIVQDSARYNVGDVNRNINLPTLALLFLESPLRPRFEWKRAGAEAVDDVSATKVQFAERGRPTLVRGNQGRDLLLRGFMWIDTDGRVRRTELLAEDQAVSARIVVTYREDAQLDMLVPGEMQERYTARQGRGVVEGTATYSNFRRFKVAVDEQIAPPRKPPAH